jgi:hypothetical protein
MAFNDGNKPKIAEGAMKCRSLEAQASAGQAATERSRLS